MFKTFCDATVVVVASLVPRLVINILLPVACRDCRRQPPAFQRSPVMTVVVTPPHSSCEDAHPGWSTCTCPVIMVDDEGGPTMAEVATEARNESNPVRLLRQTPPDRCPLIRPNRHSSSPPPAPPPLRLPPSPSPPPSALVDCCVSADF